jgi:hypothetical protein
MFRADFRSGFLQKGRNSFAACRVATNNKPQHLHTVVLWRRRRRRRRGCI